MLPGVPAAALGSGCLPHRRRRRAMAVALLLALAPAPSGGHAALEENSAACIVQGPGSLSATSGGRGWASGTPAPKTHSRRGRGLTRQGSARPGVPWGLPRRPRGSSPPGGDGRPARPAVPQARRPASTSGSGGRKHGVLEERPRLPRRRAARRPLALRSRRDRTDWRPRASGLESVRTVRAVAKGAQIPEGVRNPPRRRLPAPIIKRRQQTPFTF